MFNLLPDILKEKIRGEYKLRKLVVVVAFLVFVEISFIILIFPTWVSSYYREKEAVSLVEEMNKSSLSSTTNNVLRTIKLTNTKLSILNTSMGYPHIVPALNAVLSKKTSSIHINAMNYSFDDKKTATISLEGISGSREALVGFQKNLQNSGIFKTVDLPVSNLAKDKDLSFSMTLTFEM